jgi:hypothetical protein
MFNIEEEKLTDYKIVYDNIPVPIELVDDAILTGFQRAKLANRRKPRKMAWMISFTAAAILILFFTSIRLSPAFADYVTVIPGMEKVVKLIRYDKGMMTAVERDYYQKIGASDEKSGLKVTIDGAIADENGLVLFYTLQSKEKQKELTLEEPQLETFDGNKLDFGTASFDAFYTSEKGQKSYSGKFVYYFEKPFKTKELKLRLKVKGDKINAIYTIPFTLKKDTQAKKTYNLNKTVTIEGQKITFLDVTVYPLRVAVHVMMDPKNSKKLLDFEDLRLIDEHGETWNKISDGVTASNISDDEKMIYLQSNYFHKPKVLYLVINKIQAVDKNESSVVVDTEKEQILKQPKGNILDDLKVNKNSLVMDIHTKKKFRAFIFGSIKDGDGKEIESNTSNSTYDDEKGIISIGVDIPNLKEQKSPVSLKLESFPTWIEGNKKIKIK